MLTGDVFVSEGLIDQGQLDLAVEKHRELGGQEPIARVLVSMGLVQERDRVRCLGKVWGVSFIDIAEVTPQPEALELLSPQIARRFKAIPFQLEGNRLIVAMANPLDIFVIDELRLTTGLEIEPMIAVEEDLIAALSTHYRIDGGVVDAIAGVMKDFDGSVEMAARDDEELSEAELREMGEDAPIVRLANLIISQAVADKASDIHIEPHREGLKVRYRVDGVMLDAMQLPRKVIAPLTSRFKIMSDMDIAEKRMPQDNRIGAVIAGKPFDFRVSSLPVVHGEKIVMRVLDKGGVMVGLSKLGFLPHTLKIVEDMCAKSYGIILVTGPTGSGKSTTLYSILNKINTGSKNILTIEDPVEYEIAGINQCGVNVRAGMTFAAGLRAMLRQDPDVIMVGEMRDPETSTIAMEAALTGHLVLSTLHTNDAPGAVTRLIEMGVEPFLISSSVICVLAQRLVRMICPNCKENYHASRESLLRYGFPLPEEIGAETHGELVLFRGKGCDKCKHTGYRGRTGVHELMVMADDLRDKVLESAPSHVLRAMAMANGMRTLQMDAVQKVLSGVTSVDEVLRVIYA
ncbi:MAG: Flp pilus assembly complex ATPase component TadA [Fimbriimonas ginsengisoli]|uniref:Flp pilus assembly complex ATPase component TadA n=1 Tax=Fimbriimonas ginsengisoli TaxID=1005039 RepID=A0A931LZ15_FIMGI|nr:Flp pilus assembly complex ATPase component TadA [Fimbriimonas ginsengisoli]